MGRLHFEDIGTAALVIWFLKIRCGVGNLIYLVQDRNQWRAVVNSEKNLQAP
jgi:hypothetical protein